MITAQDRRPTRTAGILPPPTLWVPLNVWQQLMAYIQLCPTEINGFGYIDRIPGGFILSEVFILDQVASMTGVEVDERDLARHLTDMVVNGEDTGRMRFQWHSHVNMAAYFSQTDLGNIEAYDSEWMISMVANKRGEYELQVDVFKPFRFWSPIDLQIVTPASELVTEICRADIARKVRRGDTMLRRPVKPAPTAAVKGINMPAASVTSLED